MIYLLFMNDMRRNHVEEVHPVAWADSEADLKSVLEREAVEPYTTPSFRGSPYNKTFRAGGPFEWLNVRTAKIMASGTLVAIEGKLYRPLDVVHVSSLIREDRLS